MESISRMWRRARLSAASLIEDCRGVAATEFAVIVPIMLVMFFGTVEFSSGVAVDRKVTLMARTLSDLTSRSLSVGDTDMTNFFAVSGAIMTPYSTTPVHSTITELYINPSTGAARVQWSRGTSPRAVGSTVPVPASLISRDPVTNAIIANQYLIFSEVSYLYVPTVGYVMAQAGINLSDVAYTRPRQSVCVLYGTTTGSCPTS